MADGTLYGESAPARKRAKFVLNESYMHDAAKHVVAQWFRDSQDARCMVRVGDVWARTNRAGGMCGVYTEYPIGTQGEGVDPCWDEVLEAESDFLSRVYGEATQAWPTVELLDGRGIKTKCVCDVVLIHKGMLSVAIEVVHKHPTPQWKRDFLASYDIQLVEVRAQAVLHFTKRPDRLPLYVPRGRNARA